jgi:hypothetical protein
VTHMQGQHTHVLSSTESTSIHSVSALCDCRGAAVATPPAMPLPAAGAAAAAGVTRAGGEVTLLLLLALPPPPPPLPTPCTAAPPPPLRRSCGGILRSGSGGAECVCACMHASTRSKVVRCHRTCAHRNTHKTDFRILQQHQSSTSCSSETHWHLHAACLTG